MDEAFDVWDIAGSPFLTAELDCETAVMAMTSVFLTGTAGHLLRYLFCSDVATGEIECETGVVSGLCLSTHKFDKEAEWWIRDMIIILVLGALHNPVLP